jgi:hypothetical protein
MQEAREAEVTASLESLERRVEERLQQKVDFLLSRLDSATQAIMLSVSFLFLLFIFVSGPSNILYQPIQVHPRLRHNGLQSFRKHCLKARHNSYK